MRVYHALLENKGFFAKADRQPSGGGILTSPYLHDFMLNYAFYEAFNFRSHVLLDNPNYLNDLENFFKIFPVYVFPTMISKGSLATESLNILPVTRAIPEMGSGINAPQWNRWLGYKQFIAETTILSDVKLPKKFYIRLGKKRAPVQIRTQEMIPMYNEGEYPTGLISPIIHNNLKYSTGTLIKMNPTPLYLGKIEGKVINYKINGHLIFKPYQFKFFSFSGE